jgi:hypothetical protein
MKKVILQRVMLRKGKRLKLKELKHSNMTKESSTDCEINAKRKEREGI